jgi:hypothetical protein
MKLAGWQLNYRMLGVKTAVFAEAGRLRLIFQAHCKFSSIWIIFGVKLNVFLPVSRGAFGGEQGEGPGANGDGGTGIALDRM